MNATRKTSPSERTGSADFLNDVLEGLGRAQKQLTPKYFYDRRGSELFEAITELEEYYLTRTELAIMERYAPRIVELVGTGCRLVEYGSGSSTKTRLLLDALTGLVDYVPVDISCDHLKMVAKRLRRAYAHLAVKPVCADYSSPFELPPRPAECQRTVIYFPGSTIGNFDRDQARRFLSLIAGVAGPEGGLLIGVDLVKPAHLLERAYNDREGVTAAFNLNLLRRINRELSADFVLEAFEHEARWVPECGRIEMHLVSSCEQAVQVGGHVFAFRKGESIYTEASHKYTLAGFAELASGSWRVEEVFTDESELFSVQYLRRNTTENPRK